MREDYLVPRIMGNTSPRWGFASRNQGSSQRNEAWQSRTNSRRCQETQPVWGMQSPIQLCEEDHLVG